MSIGAINNSPAVNGPVNEQPSMSEDAGQDRGQPGSPGIQSQTFDSAQANYPRYPSMPGEGHQPQVSKEQEGGLPKGERMQVAKAVVEKLQNGDKAGALQLLKAYRQYLVQGLQSSGGQMQQSGQRPQGSQGSHSGQRPQGGGQRAQGAQGPQGGQRGQGGQGPQGGQGAQGGQDAQGGRGPQGGQAAQGGEGPHNGQDAGKLLTQAFGDNPEAALKATDELIALLDSAQDGAGDSQPDGMPSA